MEIADLGAMLVTTEAVNTIVVGPHVILATATIWYQLAIMIATVIVGYATAPKPKVPKPAAFEDFEFPQFEEGTPRAVIFGDCWDEDWMVLGVGNYRTTPVKTSSGKK